MCKTYQTNAECIANWLESKNDIPNAHKLIAKLKGSSVDDGHVVHAFLIKTIYENGKYKITDVEKTIPESDIDIDIELNGSINIQVHHGASFDAHRINCGDMTDLGGVPTDWSIDKRTLCNKLSQLPDTGLGIVFNVARHMGFTTGVDWEDEIPDNKVIVLTHQEKIGNDIYGMASMYFSKKFTYKDEVYNVITAAGYNCKHCNH